MDLLKLAVLQIAASFKPKTKAELVQTANELMDFLGCDEPIADDETVVEFVFTPEGTEH
jgi:hypothetical protein